MKFFIDLKDRAKLHMEIMGEDYILETSLTQEDKAYTFYVASIKDDQGETKIEWMNDVIGSIVQIFFGTAPKSKRKDISNIEAGSYSLIFRPMINVEGIIDQTYGFIPQEEPYFMIPGHIYNSNNIKNSKSIQPQLNYRGDIAYPKTPVIYTRADRSTHNAVLVMNKTNLLAVRIEETTKEMCELRNSYNKELDYLYNGLGIDTKHMDSLDRISVTMGYHHFPVHYYGKLGPDSHSEKDERHTIHFGNNIEYVTTGHFYSGSISNKFGYENAIQYFYEEIHEHPGNKVDRVTAVLDIVKALTEDAYNNEYHYFPTILSGGRLDTGIGGDMAWTGGMQVVYPMIRASKYSNRALEIPFDFIDNLINEGFNEKANLFYDAKRGAKWVPSGWWTHNLHLYDEFLNRILSGHSAYVNGQATTYLLKSYQYLTENPEKLQGKKIDHWQDKCFTIIDHVIKHQRYDGALGVYYHPESGKPLYYNSFQGTWFLAAIAEAYKITGKLTYKKAFDKANEFYWSFVEKLELWGMPMDIEDAVDEEGNLAYITALKTMHEVTHDKKLLESLVHCFHYEFSWKFAYNTVHVNEPLKSLNWPSCGGSITSSHNIHIHQMGNLVCEEMYYVYEQTKDPYILSRLKDTLNWGLGTHNSEEIDFGFGSRGWATEQFFHTDGKQDDNTRIVDGGIWYDYLSWAAACCLLSSSLDLEDDLYKP